VIFNHVMFRWKCSIQRTRAIIPNSPNRHSIEAYNEIGVALLHVKNYQSAREYFTKASSASAAWSEEAQRNLPLADEQLHDAAR